MTLEMTKKTYSRTPSGKSWKSKPDEIETSVVSLEFWLRVSETETLTFFRSLGGSETVKRAYTSFGYIAVEVVSESPDRLSKIVKSIKVE